MAGSKELTTNDLQFPVRLVKNGKGFNLYIPHHVAQIMGINSDDQSSIEGTILLQEKDYFSVELELEI